MAQEGTHYPIAVGPGLSPWLYWQAKIAGSVKAGEPVGIHPAATRLTLIAGAKARKFFGIATTDAENNDIINILVAGFTHAYVSGFTNPGKMLTSELGYMKQVTWSNVHNTWTNSQAGCAISFGNHTTTGYKTKIPMLILPWRSGGL